MFVTVAGRRTRRNRRDEAGVVAVIVALFATTMLLCAGLVADLGEARDLRQQAQNTADASALAAANAVYVNGVPNLLAGTAAAKQYAQQDLGITDSQWAGCTDTSPLPVASGTPCISYDSAIAPKVVRVVMPTQNLTLPIGALAGSGHAAISAVAQATVLQGDRAKCGLCVIGPGLHNIQNGDIAIAGSSAFFNGSLAANPQGSVTVSGAGSTISVQTSISTKGTFSPDPLLGVAPVPDPLGFLAVPPNTTGLLPKTGDACTNGPGIYYSTLSLHTCTLRPGIYVLAGNATQEHESGQVNVTAPGVTIYLTCADLSHAPTPCLPGQAGASLLLTGQASLTITAPTSGPTKGISLLVDRNSTAPFGFRGNGSAGSTGTIYAKNAQFEYDGNGSGTALDSLIVVGDLTFNGNNASLSSTYTLENNAGMPPAAPFLSK